MKKKILSITTFILGSNAASWRILNIMKALQKEGYVVDLIQYVKKKPLRTFDLQSVELDGIRTRILQSSRPRAFLIHLNQVLKNDYHLVIGNTTNGALFSLLGRLKIPLLFDMHGADVEEYKLLYSFESGWRAFHSLTYIFLFRVASLLTLNLSNKISCVSHTMMSYLNDKGIPMEKLVYAPNCVDLELFCPLSPTDQKVTSLKRELGIDKGKLIFGYVGGFQKWQGVESIVNAAKKIRDERVLFLIVGGNETKREGNLLFVSRITRKRIPLYYSVCDVLLLPRPSHPATEIAAPTKFVEYAAMGKPVLATNVGDAADLVRKYNCGVIIKNNSVKELVDGVTCMKESKAEERIEMGKAARLLAQKEFSFDETIGNLSKCINELT